MQNHEFVAGLRSLQELLRFLHGGVRQIEPDGAGRVVNSQRLQQGEMVIDGVEKAHRRFHELVVAPGANLRAEVRVVRGDALSRLREQRQKGGAIVAGEIEAVIKIAPRERDPIERIVRFPPEHENFVDARDRREQLLDRGRDHQGESCLREFFPQRRDRRRGENQVADSLQLNEENVHRTRARDLILIRGLRSNEIRSMIEERGS